MKTGLQQFAATAGGGGPGLTAAFGRPPSQVCRLAERTVSPSTGRSGRQPRGRRSRRSPPASRSEETWRRRWAASRTPSCGSRATRSTHRISSRALTASASIQGDRGGSSVRFQCRSSSSRATSPSTSSTTSARSRRRRRSCRGRSSRSRSRSSSRKARLVFCIPENEELLATGTASRTGSTRSATVMDIAGVRRRLELFAPEIDPRLLVRMRAAGLSLDDVMNVTSGNLPPYRFSYLIEKAKQHASVVQAFGDQVLSALEKRDAEELTRLAHRPRAEPASAAHSQSVQLEIDAAEDALAASTASEPPRCTGGSTSRRSARRVCSPRRASSSSSSNRPAASGRWPASPRWSRRSSTIIPDVGAPTAMKFGGSQLGAAARAVAEGYNAVAAFDGAAVRRWPDIEGSNRRRDQEWEHQAEMAKRELAQLDKQIAAAEIRRDIAASRRRSTSARSNRSRRSSTCCASGSRASGSSRGSPAELQKLHRMAFNAALTHGAARRAGVPLRAPGRGGRSRG